MKRPLMYLLPAVMAVPTLAFCQSKNDKSTLSPPPAHVTIDGSLAEWGDSLRYFNADKKINYTIANDAQNVYIAVRLNERTEQRRAMMAGITLTIDPKGKKKDTYQVTFPYTDPEAAPAERLKEAIAEGQQPAPPDGNADQNREERMQVRLTNLKQIKATGFPDVLNEVITTSNTYGIKTAMNLDADGYLVYEAEVPIAMFHADDAFKNEWAFNIKINGIQRPKRTEGGGSPQGGGMGPGGGMGGGRGGMGGGRGGRGGRGGGMRGGSGGGSYEGGNSEMSKSVDFWEKYYLAQ